uniref:Uncharacterized protein n=1 Tax=Physcomitrium patens TaxID=3218 RepID=A0A2K1K2V7_PHYPA|nr:hypothetical protein PHYPA_012579 [Physcomitrium patens]
MNEPTKSTRWGRRSLQATLGETDAVHRGRKLPGHDSLIVKDSISGGGPHKPLERHSVTSRQSPPTAFGVCATLDTGVAVTLLFNLFLKLLVSVYTPDPFHLGEGLSHAHAIRLLYIIHA